MKKIAQLVVTRDKYYAVEFDPPLPYDYRSPAQRTCVCYSGIMLDEHGNVDSFFAAAVAKNADDAEPDPRCILRCMIGVVDLDTFVKRMGYVLIDPMEEAGLRNSARAKLTDAEWRVLTGQ